MEANNSKYDIVSSSNHKLNYTNGYYVDVGALFIDIRQYSGLTEIHKKPSLRTKAAIILGNIGVIFTILVSIYANYSKVLDSRRMRF